MSLLKVFADNLLPVLLAAGAGWLLAVRLNVPARPLAHAGFYVFAPCLVFQVIADTEIPAGDLARMAGFSAAVLAIPAAAVVLLARGLRWTRTRTAAAALVVLLPNAGNFGMPASLFAFGEEGLAQASIFFVTSSILTYTVGVFIASLGRVGAGAALVGLVRVPAVWAVAIGFLLKGQHGALPFPLARTVELLADACIPVFLVILGMQLRGAQWRGKLGALGICGGMRMAGGVAVGIALAPLFGLEGVGRQAGILQSAMPSAVITTILAVEYEVEPAFVTAVVFATTLLSPLILTPVLAYLGA